MTLLLVLAGALAADSWPVTLQGKPFTTLYAGPGKPYLHPIRTASGKIVSRQYPMAVVPGESNDHPHHRGLWFTHGDVNGWDFWANEESQKGVGKGRGTVRIVDPKGAPARFTAHWVDGDGKTLLVERRQMTFGGDDAIRTIDLDIALTAQMPVTFGDTKEGTLAIRLADSMIEKNGGGKMTAASGASGEKAVWGKTSPWVDYAGTVDGETVGVAILDHPANPGHPAHWHSRAYGLFAANIFGLHDFYGDKSKDGSRSLKSGEEMRFRYRVVVHPGATDAVKIGDWWRGFAGK